MQVQHLGKINLFATVSVTVALLFVALLYVQYGRVTPGVKIGVL